MAGIQVIAGSFPKGWASMGFGTIVFAKKPKQGFPENIVLNLKEELLSIELADSEEESRIGKARRRFAWWINLWWCRVGHWRFAWCGGQDEKNYHF